MYDDLIFGSYNIRTVLDAVNDATWQSLRIDLKGRTTEDKLAKLREYVSGEVTEDMKVQVTNYVYALKRGGQLK